MLVYPSSIDLSSRTLRFLTGRLTARRKDIGTRWRRLPASRQALLALAILAPSLTEAMQTFQEKAFVILDGTLLPIDRIAADTPYYSGKHKGNGMYVQILTDPFGRLLWAWPALPESAHDLTAARQHGIIEALTEVGLRCWADKAYQGAPAGPSEFRFAAGASRCGSVATTPPTRRSAVWASRLWPHS
ncbi:hypothetical protein TUSST3_55290 [Streptomyces sp. TUS-ST3]|nr:hypothetical protein TUSST3_55290 [Streptomyces sp. TUS-ST3]